MNTIDLDKPLLEYPDKDHGSSYLTIRDAVEGIQIFGGIGSGKTSGSGRMIALKYLANGFGGLVLTVKPDEKDAWVEYCRMTNRTDDLIIVEPQRKNYFNFLAYEFGSQAQDISITENIVQVLKTVIRASEEKSSGKSDDPFWETALDMLLFNVIDLCQLAYGKVTVQSLYDLVQAAPKNAAADGFQRPQKETSKKLSDVFDEAFTLAQDNVVRQIKLWESQQPNDWLAALSKEDYELEICNALPDARLLKFIDQFFFDVFMNLSERTRSIIDFSFSGFLFRLLKDPVYNLFCRHESTFTPDDCMKGKIILINLPVKKYHKIGRDCQILFKFIWQRAMEKRDTSVDVRPVFLWADEAQNFIHEHDVEYQATARSSLIATVYISQNLPNYHANMGTAKSEYRVKGFLGTLATKIFHANADLETNVYASDLIGEAYIEDNTRSVTTAGDFSVTRGVSFKLEKMVRSEVFVSLKTGGPNNKFRTEAYIHRQGSPFANRFNYIKMSFNQNFTPSIT